LTIHPHVLAFVYFLYLAIVAVLRGPGRARRVSGAVLVATSAVSAGLADAPASTPVSVLEQVWALALLFVAYRTAGVFYERPDEALESRLLAVDRRLGISRAASSPAVTALLEAAYVCVYLVIPAGAIVVVRTASPGAAQTFWTTVLAAGFVCYGALPWLQTRPPRAIERPAHADAPAILRRLNLAILKRGSVGVNTLPSGHAATAVAVALSVWSSAPLAGALFGLLALLIAASTIAGRYHYAVDTALGVAVGVGAWCWFG
jgi:membrane-associated phospholipid phosphatase